MSALEQRVAAGAALLDRERPGWWEEVDTERLRMSSYCACVLGQLYDDYAAGALTVLGETGDATINHGFYDMTGRNHDLDRLWLAAIAERRARADSVGPTAEAKR